MTCYLGTCFTLSTLESLRMTCLMNPRDPHTRGNRPRSNTAGTERPPGSGSDPRGGIPGSKPEGPLIASKSARHAGSPKKSMGFLDHPSCSRRRDDVTHPGGPGGPLSSFEMRGAGTESSAGFFNECPRVRGPPTNPQDPWDSHMILEAKDVRSQELAIADCVTRPVSPKSLDLSIFACILRG